MTFLIKRGSRARRGVAVCHIAKHDAYGQIAGAWCWRTGFDMSCNLPLGLRRCKDCTRRANA